MRKEICWGAIGGLLENLGCLSGGGEYKQQQPYLSTVIEDVNLDANLNPRLIKNLEISKKYYENTAV